MGKIILGILGALSIGLLGYVSLCLLAGRTPLGGPVVAVIALVAPTVVAGMWFGLGPRREVVADHARCRACDYNLTGHDAVLGRPDVRCPECGEPLLEANIIRAGELDAAGHPRSVRGFGTLYAAAMGLVFWIETIDRVVRGQRDWRLWAMGVCAILLTASLGLKCWMFVRRRRQDRSEGQTPLS